ncbi:MAG: TetR/AcrR family transcriptional regulator [Myxococcota bacterium]
MPIHAPAVPPATWARIRDAGHHVFATNAWPKASMSAIAKRAGVSKALLFYHFETKQALYLSLFHDALEFLHERKLAWNLDEEQDLFAAVERTIEFRIAMMAEVPHLFRFLAAAYRETHEEVRAPLDAARKQVEIDTFDRLTHTLDRARLRHPDELPTLLRIITLAAEGFVQRHEAAIFDDGIAALATFRAILDSLKRHYYRPDFLEPGPPSKTLPEAP